jgi:mannose/fructose/N-acetylgalactosamine-specific phosphotransferase system component IID
MGDQLFWAGLVPALVGLTVVAVVLGAGWWAIGGFLLAYNAVRIWTGYWSLRTGMTAGMRVGAAIRSSWLPRAIEWAGPAAGFALGALVPLVAMWYLTRFGWAGALGVAGVATAGVALTRWFGPGLTSVRFAVLAMLLLLFFRRVGL